MKLVPICVLCFVLAGCASVSEVTPLGANRYMVGSHVRGGLTSWAEVKTMAVDRAAGFCAGKGMVVEVASIETTGTQGWTPQNADVTFTCTGTAR